MAVSHVHVFHLFRISITPTTGAMCWEKGVKLLSIQHNFGLQGIKMVTDKKINVIQIFWFVLNWVENTVE